MTENPTNMTDIPEESNTPDTPDTPPVENDVAEEVPVMRVSSETVDKDQQENVARLERLGGEPAPDITPEEFARLQQSGQVHIDPLGRVRSPRYGTTPDEGVSLRKRRAWY